MKDTEIKAALEATLAKNHLTKTDADSADLYIGYQVGVVAEKQLASTTRIGHTVQVGTKKVGTPVPSTTRLQARQSTLSPGELAEDMYDSANHCLVWRGVVSMTRTPRPHPTNRKRTSINRSPSS